MGAMFQKLFQRNLIVYQPQQWSKRLGEKCSKCEKGLTHERCISLCKCYYFCHQQCFKTGFQEQIHNENTDIKCQKCDTQLRLQLNVQFKYGPLVTKQKLCKLALSFCLLILIMMGIVVTLYSEIRVEYAFFILYLQGILLSLMLYYLFVCIRDLFYKKVIKISQVLSTKLDIQTSAFKDIQMQTNEEMTKDCLYTQKK